MKGRPGSAGRRAAGSRAFRPLPAVPSPRNRLADFFILTGIIIWVAVLGVAFLVRIDSIEALHAFIAVLIAAAVPIIVLLELKSVKA